MISPADPASPPDSAAPLLSVRDLSVGFAGEQDVLQAVDTVSFDVRAGRTLGIVGESGCGKSVTALTLLRLLPYPAGRVLGGQVIFEGRDLLSLPLSEMQKIRGGRIGMIFQEPMSALNPVMTIGRQLGEVFRLHLDISPDEARRRSISLLGKVGIPSPEIRLHEYPHQLSGGMRQRVVIAMALACEPALLIADEPTTALDVTIQAQILELIASLQREMGLAVILITHDLGVIAETCDDVIVMYAGRVAEVGPIDALFAYPKHPYTRGLLASIPRLTTEAKSRLPVIEGMVPTLRDLPHGCRFANRCPHARPRCTVAPPPLEFVDPKHSVACIRWREIE